MCTNVYVVNEFLDDEFLDDIVFALINCNDTHYAKYFTKSSNVKSLPSAIELAVLNISLALKDDADKNSDDLQMIPISFEIQLGFVSIDICIFYYLYHI